MQQAGLRVKAPGMVNKRRIIRKKRQNFEKNQKKSHFAGKKRGKMAKNAVFLEKKPKKRDFSRKKLDKWRFWWYFIKSSILGKG